MWLYGNYPSLVAERVALIQVILKEGVDVCLFGLLNLVGLFAPPDAVLGMGPEADMPPPL